MRWRRDHQGAVAVMMALMICVVLIPISALAVDIGVQRVARRDMQAVADLVALDLSRQLTGKTLSNYDSATLDAVVAASLNRNASSTNLANGAKPSVAWELGTTDPALYGQSGYFTKMTNPSGTPTAVRVSATTTVGFGLARALPGGGIGSGSATRSAVAVSQSSACFTLGSYAAALDTNDSALLSPLNKLLGLNLSLISYKGLAAAGLNLGSLAADTSIGSVDTLLGGNVTLNQFTAAAITVLSKDSNNAAAVSALQAIRASGIDLSKKVDVLKIVSLQKTDSAALNTNFNALDLVAGAIEVANGDHGVDISSLNIAGITGSVQVTERAKHACGPPNDPSTVAHSSQIQAALNVPLTFPTGSSVLGLTVTGSATVSGGLGNATGALVSPPGIVCKSGTTADPDTYRVDVSSGLLGLGVTANLNINGTVSTGLLGGLLDLLLGVVVKVEFNNVGITLGAGAPGTGTTAHADLRVPQNSVNHNPRGTPYKVGPAYTGTTTIPTVSTTTAFTGTITISTTGLLGLGPVKLTTIDLSRGGGVGNLLATLLGTINNQVLTPVVNNTLIPNLNALLVPLGKLLGVNVGGADVYSEDRPTCNGAKLAG